MPNELYPDSDPSPSPRVEAWVRARLEREFPELPEQVIASAIRNAAALVYPRRRRGVTLSVARSCLPVGPIGGEVALVAEVPVVALLQRCLPAFEDPPDSERFNREIFASLLARGGGQGRVL